MGDQLTQLISGNSNSSQFKRRAIRVTALVLFGIVGVVLISLYWHRQQFARDLRNAVIGPSDGIEICSLRREHADDCTVLGDSPKDSALRKALSGAEASLEPGKVPIVSERILRIRENGLPTGQYARCYRLVELQGFTEVYVTEVEMDRGCTHIERYRTGSARIPFVQ